jgi:hypothetical protein
MQALSTAPRQYKRRTKENQLHQVRDFASRLFQVHDGMTRLAQAQEGPEQLLRHDLLGINVAALAEMLADVTGEPAEQEPPAELVA